MKIRLLMLTLIFLAAPVAVLAQDDPKKDAPPAAKKKTLSLTLRDCYEMALRNNLDISIERIAPRIAATSILSEQAAFDPSLALNGSFLANSRPNAGFASTRSEQIATSLTVDGRVQTGAEYRLGLNNTGAGNNLNGFDHAFTSFAGISVSQPLLKNRGAENNLIGIRVARKNLEISVDVLTDRIMQAVGLAQKAYFDFVFALEELEVRRRSLALAQTLLEENRTRLRAGVMSPLDVTEAEAAVAARQEDVLVAERAVLDQENLLKRIISSDVASLRDTTLIPADQPLTKEVPVNADVSIREAIENRPDYLQAKHEVERRALVLQFTRNQLLPQIDLQGSFGVNGLRSDYFPAYESAFQGRDPQWSVGLAITIPLGSKRERANHQSAKLESERALLALKRVEQTIFVEVDNAAGAVQTNFKRIAAAEAAERLAKERWEAERKKVAAGTSTTFFELQFQQDYIRAQANKLRAILDYNKALIDFYSAEGTLLKRLGVEVMKEK